EQRRDRQLVAAVAGPGRAVGLDDVLLRVHVAASDAPVLRHLVVHAQQVFTARRLVGHLARVVETGAAGEVGGREDVEDAQAGLIEAAGGNLTEDAAVLEAAPRIGRAAGKPALVVANVRERVAAGVDALREVARAFQGRRHARLMLARRIHAPFELLAEEEEQLLPFG